jgi:hypothetical protein
MSLAFNRRPLNSKDKVQHSRSSGGNVYHLSADETTGLAFTRICAAARRFQALRSCPSPAFRIRLMSAIAA